MIDENLIQKIRFWASIIGSGGSIGFIIGAIIALKVEPSMAKLYFWGFIIGGFITGLIVAAILSKNENLNKGFEPLNRSEDLDNYYEKFLDLDQDNKILELLPRLTNDEFISLISFRYPQMLTKTKSIMKQELIERNINKQTFLEKYSTIEIFKENTEGQCPKCGFKEYKLETDQGIVNCELCGYYDKLENPHKFINRLKKLMGFYYEIGISENTIEKDLYC